MARPLDFIVFGVPRSGTKALVHTLNLHPHVYCAEERFHFRTDHSRLTFPGSFLDAGTIYDRQDLAKIERIREELAQKEDVRHPGNKLPRYFFALDRVNREVPALKNIWIYRSPYGFMQSWNSREIDSHRGQWPAGQIGLFGLLELLICAENALSLGKDTFVFPYTQGLGGSPDVTIEALGFLGADPHLYDSKNFDKTQRRQARKRRANGSQAPRRASLKDYEEEILDTLRIKDLDRVLDGGSGVMVSAVSGDLRDYLDGISANLPEAIDRAFSACDNRAVPSFGREYLKRNRAELQGLLKRAEGSRVLAGFQQFGAYEHLKALFVQRFALKRRLAALRPSG